MRAWFAVLLVVLSACATAETAGPGGATAAAQPEVVDAGPPPAPAPPPVASIDALRAEAKKLLEVQADLYWRNWTTGEAIDVASTYKGHEALFALPAIAEVQAAANAETDPQKKRALDYFALYLAGEHINQQVASLGDQVANLEGSATVTFDGSEIPYRNIDPLLANEPDHARRVALSNAALPVLARLNPLLEQKEARTEALVKELGYPSYSALGARMRDVDLDALARQADQVLTETDALYKKAMAEAVNKELNLPLADMRRADIPRFFHAANVQSLFPSAQMMSRFRALLAGMGIDLDALKLTIDDKATPRKNPRAVCFPVVVPTDVRLSIKPQGGVDDYAQLFHEGGHALHFASTTTPVWEFQQLGNGTVTEAYAFLLEDLLEDPRYLGEVGMTGELLRSYVRSSAVKKLYMLRRYCAKVMFERAWHQDPPLQGDALKARYKELLSRAYGFPMTDEDAARVLTDHDDFFYSADYLRAWFLAAQVSDALERKYGATWWHSADAGKTLRALMAHGNGLTADEVVQQLGDKQLDFGPLVKLLNERLR